MANSVLQRPFVLDTVMGAGNALGRPIRVASVTLVGGSTASSFTIIEPVSGKILCQGSCVIGDTITIPVHEMWKDFRLSALAGTGAIVLINT